VLLVAKIMTGIASEDRNPAEVLDELLGEGLPGSLVRETFEAAAKAVESHQQGKGGRPPKAKKVSWTAPKTRPRRF
jgi:hypothetical protein